MEAYTLVGKKKKDRAGLSLPKYHLPCASPSPTRVDTFVGDYFDRTIKPQWASGASKLVQAPASQGVVSFFSFLFVGRKMLFVHVCVSLLSLLCVCVDVQSVYLSVNS